MTGLVGKTMFNIKKYEYFPSKINLYKVKNLQMNINLDVNTYKGSLKSNFIGQGGLFGDCQNKPNKIDKYYFKLRQPVINYIKLPSQYSAILTAIF